MDCSYYDAGLCRSCTLIEQPYAVQLDGKQLIAHELLAPHDPVWLPAVASAEAGFRNKAKMVVAGTVDEPTIGILDDRGRGIDLRHCGLIAPGILAALPVLGDFIGQARLEPYDVPSRRGELKHLLVTESPAGELMVRFVLRSTESVARLRSRLAALQTVLPQARVVTANILAEHKAVVEGEREIVLTDTDTLDMRLADVELHLRPQSFFQTNTTIAIALYTQAREWVDELAPASVWDLYCGVGGFALHVATPGRTVTGIEISPEAIESAKASAASAGLDLRFHAGDATAFALASDEVPDLVIVNPPRRGIGPALAEWLERRGPRHVVYSSCNAHSLAKDLAAMPSYRVRRARVLDMFPNSTHFEVITLLERV